MPYIVDVFARQIFDSSSNPCLEVEITSENGSVGRGVASFNYYSTDNFNLNNYKIIKDYDDTKFFGNSLSNVVDIVKEVIAPEILGYDVKEQRLIDKLLESLDDTNDLSKVGKLAIVATSLAVNDCAKTYSNMSRFKYIGGAFASVIPSLIIPVVGIVQSSNTITELSVVIKNTKLESAMNYAYIVTNKVEEELKKEESLSYSKYNLLTTSKSIEEVISIINNIITSSQILKDAGIKLHISFNTSSLFNKDTKKYTLNNKLYDKNELSKYIIELVQKNNVAIVDEPFHMNDISSYKELNKKLYPKVLVSSNTLYQASLRKLNASVKESLTSFASISLSNCITLSKFVEFATNKSNIKIILDSSNDFINSNYYASLAVGLSIPYLKLSSIYNPVTNIIVNELIRIEEELDTTAIY